MKLDLNADLGEGESLSRARALMRWITSANIACGGHAGDVQTMTRCARLARDHAVRLGAHPGLVDRRNFGRAALRMHPSDLEQLLLHQVAAVERIAREAGHELHHVKLHGALYHLTESDARLRQAYVVAMKRWWPHLRLYVLAGGRVAQAARRHRLSVWEEAFADRGYQASGHLQPRDKPGALLTRPSDVKQRLERLVGKGELVSIDGVAIKRRPKTICIHADTPGAVAMARLAAGLLG